MFTLHPPTCSPFTLTHVHPSPSHTHTFTHSLTHTYPQEANKADDDDDIADDIFANLRTGQFKKRSTRRTRTGNHSAGTSSSGSTSTASSGTLGDEVEDALAVLDTLKTRPRRQRQAK
jgi:hypothetical protein